MRIIISTIIFKIFDQKGYNPILQERQLFSDKTNVLFIYLFFIFNQNHFILISR